MCEPFMSGQTLLCCETTAALLANVGMGGMVLKHMLLQCSFFLEGFGAEFALKFVPKVVPFQVS